LEQVKEQHQERQLADPGSPGNECQTGVWHVLPNNVLRSRACSTSSTVCCYTTW